MTPKEITTLAGHRLLPPWVMKLALEVAAAEREACAKVCEGLGWGNNPDVNPNAGTTCAAAIRSRNNAS